ncbi:hypothetical protein ACTOWY_00665 [Crossiella sp. CA198]
MNNPQREQNDVDLSDREVSFFSLVSTFRFALDLGSLTANKLTSLYLNQAVPGGNQAEIRKHLQRVRVSLKVARKSMNELNRITAAKLAEDHCERLGLPPH